MWTANLDGRPDSIVVSAQSEAVIAEELGPGAAASDADAATVVHVENKFSVERGAQIRTGAAGGEGHQLQVMEGRKEEENFFHYSGDCGGAPR